jgi:hypothetical protein
LDGDIENCLTVEYLLPLNQNDELQLYIIGDNINIKIVTLRGNTATSPQIPNIPSIILNVVQISI